MIANTIRLIALGIVLTISVHDPVWAAEPLVNTTEANVAIHGYDPVAYFEEGEPRRGSPQYSALWRGAKWHFASDANRRRFLSDPQRYAPRYGGFCAYAASYGQIADIDPLAWSIIDGRLYLNYSERVREIWRPRAAEFIPDADILWPMVIEEHERPNGQ